MGINLSSKEIWQFGHLIYIIIIIIIVIVYTVDGQ